MRGEEPCPERQVAAVRHRASRHRGLASAARALAEEALPLGSQPFAQPQAGQRKPPPQRSPARWRANGIRLTVSHAAKADA